VSANLGSRQPHNPAHCNVLGDAVLARLAPAPENPQDVRSRRALSLLVHEQLHVLQRKDPRRFDDLYTRVWKFRRVETIEGGDKLNGRVIINPDAPRNEWVHPVSGGRWVWPLMVFREGTDLTDASLMRMEQAAAEVEEVPGGKHFRFKGPDPELRPLEDFEDYMQAYFPTAYSYHPNEASADLLATLVSYDSLGEKDAIPEEQREKFEAALDPLRKWFREHLAQSP
jgi:hypothetical protein